MKQRTFQYKKIQVPKNDYIQDFYVVMGNQIQLGYTIQDRKTAKAIVDWLHSIEETDAIKAKARS